MLGALELEKVTMCPAVRVNLPIFPGGWNTRRFRKDPNNYKWALFKNEF